MMSTESATTPVGRPASKSASPSASHSSSESAADVTEFPPQPKAKAKGKKEPLSKSALEQRRRRNRESMQRARERERGDIARMRVELQQLEEQYRNAAQAHTVFLTQYVNPQLAAFNTLAHESKALKLQNYQLQQELEARRKAYERMERIVADYFVEKDDAVEMMDEDQQDLHFNAASAPLDSTGPMTEAEAFHFIHECCRDIEAFERTAEGPAMQHIEDCFGWNIKHQVTDGSRMRFLFTKQFSHVYPHETMDEAWELYGKLSHNNLKSLRVLRLEVLQQINRDTQLMVRDIAHPLDKGVILRTIMVRFRLKTELGLIGGRVSINPVSPPPDAHVRYADVTSWVEFRYLDPSRPDDPGCTVTFGGFADYRTNREISSRFLTVLSTVLTMEHRLFQPVLHLLPQTNDEDDEDDAGSIEERAAQKRLSW